MYVRACLNACSNESDRYFATVWVGQYNINTCLHMLTHIFSRLTQQKQ